MTEVDYSPEAYNRYMATRARVGNWAAETSSYAAQYTHPFESHQPRTTPGAFGPVPEVRPSDSISLYDPSERARAERERSRSRGREMGGERPSHPRARSIPNAHNRVHPGPPPPTPALPFYVSPQSQQHPDRSRAPPSSAYTTIDLSKFTSYAEGSEFRLPSLRAGETYMLIPPKGMRVEVIPPATAGGSHTFRLTSSTSSTSRAAHHVPSAREPRVVPHTGAPSSRPSRVTSPTPVTYVAPGGYGYVQPQVYASGGMPPPAISKHAPPPAKKPLLKRLLTSADKPRGVRRDSQ